MKNILKLAYFTVLLALSLAIANPAFGADMKTKPADNAVVLPDLSFSEGYSGGYFQPAIPEIPVDVTKLNTDLTPTEGYSGGYATQTTTDIFVADAGTLNTDLSPSEGYRGGYSAEIVKEASSGAMAQANAVDSSSSKVANQDKAKPHRDEKPKAITRMNKGQNNQETLQFDNPVRYFAAAG